MFFSVLLYGIMQVQLSHRLTLWHSKGLIGSVTNGAYTVYFFSYFLSLFHSSTVPPNVVFAKSIFANRVPARPRHSLGLLSPVSTTSINYTALHCTALFCTILHCTAQHCTNLHYTALYCTALYCTTLAAGWFGSRYMSVNKVIAAWGVRPNLRSLLR